MAEGVDFAMVQIAKEVEEMRNMGLFTEDMLKELIQKRGRFENKRRNIPKRLENYTDYIAFEKNILKLIQRNRIRQKAGSRTYGIESKVINRINKLYAEAVHTYSDNYDLCVNHFLFCKSLNNVSIATTAIDFVLKNHSNRETSWNLAASWYATCRKDVKDVLEILLKGIALHPTSELLYKQILSVELSNIRSAMKKYSDNNPKEIKERADSNCEKLKYYLNAIFKNIKDLDFYFELLRLFDSYNFTASLKKLVMEHLISNFGKESPLWNALAFREYTGLNGDHKNVSDQERFSLSCDIFTKGLQEVAESDKNDLWRAYIDHLVEGYKKNIVSATDVEKWFSQAHDEKGLSESQYGSWLELSNDNQVESIFKKALEIHPQSEKLWEQNLKYKIRKRSPEEEICRIFKEGKAALGENALPLFLVLIKYYLSINATDELDNLYKSAIDLPPQISHALAPDYLKWMVVTRGMDISEARNLYNILSTRTPYCKRLHTIMAILERAEEDMNKLEKVLELATEQFPTDLDVWHDYMNFFIHIKKSAPDRKKVYNRAISMLPDINRMQFESQYSSVSLE